MKRTILYAILVPILILVLLLFAFNSRAWDNPVKPVKIPDGWEVISNEENSMYIRMKEGSDSRVWIEHREDDDFFMDVYLPGGKDHVAQTYGSDETIPAIVYFGYGKRSYDADRDIYYINPALPPPEYTDYELIMREYEDGRYFSTFLLDLPNFTDTANVEYTSENKVGYTHGVIVNIPVSSFQDAKNDDLNFSLRAKGESHSDGSTHIYFTHDTKKNKMIVETEHDAWENDLQYGFPQMLTKPRIMIVVVNCTLLLSILIFTILSLVRKKGYGLPHVFIALALLLNFVMAIWLDKETSGYLVFDFSWLIFYIALFSYLTLAAILGVVQLFATWIPKWIAKKRLHKLSSTQIESTEQTQPTVTTDTQ